MTRNVGTYGHFRLIARALERVGGRWSLLVIRDLLTGANSLTDRMNRLGGITPQDAPPSVLLTAYGGLNVLVGALVLSGVIHPAGSVDRNAALLVKAVLHASSRRQHPLAPADTAAGTAERSRMIRALATRRIRDS